MEAAEEEEEEEEEAQEQRHPNGRGAASGRKQEGRATRSRVATGRGMPLVPAAGSADGQQSAEDEAAELLSTLGSLLSVPQLPPGTPLGAPSPLLCSPASRAAAGVGAANEGQQPGADAATAAQQEEAAVKAFLKRLPQAGVGRQELAAQLLGTLATASAAAQLSPAVRYQLLQVAHQAQHSVSQHAVAPSHCLVLGELFTDAAAGAVEASKQRMGGGLMLVMQGGAAAAAPKPGGVDTSPQAAGRTGGMARRPSGRAKRLELSTAALQQSARLWLSRYRLAAAEQPPAGGPLQAEPLAEQGVAQELPAGMVRYWWATGRLLESEGDMVAARAAYATCEQGLPMLPGEHCGVMWVTSKTGAAAESDVACACFMPVRDTCPFGQELRAPTPQRTFRSLGFRQHRDPAAAQPGGCHHQRSSAVQQAGGAAAALCTGRRTA